QLLLPYPSLPHRDLPSFPTRRSSDLWPTAHPVGTFLSVSLTKGICPARRGGSKTPRCLMAPRCETKSGNTLRPTLKLFPKFTRRSEEHTSELQSRFDLVCRLLLEKKK